MALVRAGHQHVLGGILRDILSIVGVAVTGHVKTVGLEKILRQFAAHQSLTAATAQQQGFLHWRTNWKTR
jgi:hypothetical protein